MIFENKLSKIEISNETSAVLSVFDKVNSKEIKGEDSYFFCLLGKDKETKYIPQTLKMAEDIITVETELGSFSVKVITYDEYYTFELVSSLPEGAYKLVMANCKYNYNNTGKNDVAAVGLALTYWVNHCFYPDGVSMETRAEVVRHLKDKGAQYALVIAPFEMHREILKKLCEAADLSNSVICRTGGPWSRDIKENFGNCIIQFDTSREFLESNLEFYKNLGVDIIDFHKVYFPENQTFRQGDFKYVLYKDGAEFKEKVSDFLNEHGIATSLHTYAQLIDFDCDTILSSPKWQKDLKINRTVTLKESLGEDDEFIEVNEKGVLTSEFGFLLKTTPFVLIDNEIIRFEVTAETVKVVERGVAGTKKTSHQKGASVNQIEGIYGCFTPVIGSELFYQIARDTAKAYNEGGYSAIYLDALDSIINLCNHDMDESVFYFSAFVNEVLKYCKKPPLMENAVNPSIYLWGSRGRVGAFDTPSRSYKNWNRFHLEFAKKYMNMHLVPSLGWYDFYVLGCEDFLTSEGQLPNTLIRYEHTDDVEFIGSLSLMYNCTMTFQEINAEKYNSVPALKRNIAIYRKYDKLRKEGYFKEEFLKELRQGKYEYHIASDDNGNYFFVEKDFQVKKVYDLNDEIMNSQSFSNPFEEQTPFIRIENMFSSAFENPVTIMDKYTCDEKENTFEIDQQKTPLEGRHAKKVTITSDGKDGSVVIKLKGIVQGGDRFTGHIINTNFKGTRDFVLVEAENGVNPEAETGGDSYYSIYRRSLSPEDAEKLVISSIGDVSGVKIENLVADKCVGTTFKNPSVSVNSEKIVFNCEIKSGEYLEFDGNKAKVIDGMGNEKEVAFVGNITIPRGDYKAKLTCENQSVAPHRADFTIGVSGKHIK